MKYLLKPIEAAKRINFLFPCLPMIAISMEAGELTISDIIGAGDRGFVCKSETSDKLTEAIEKVLANKFVFGRIVVEDFRIKIETLSILHHSNNPGRS